MGDSLDKYSYEVMNIPPGELTVPVELQRICSEAMVNRIVRDYNPMAFDDLLVNIDSISLKREVISGQHRREAALRLRLPTVRCKVYFNLPLDVKVRVMRDQNESKRPQAIERYRWDVMLSKPDALGVQQIVEGKHAITISKSSAVGRHRKVSSNQMEAIALVREIWGWDQGETLDKTLGLINQAWFDDAVRLYEPIIGGVAYFLRRYKRVEYDLDILLRKLQAMDATELLQKGIGQQRSNVKCTRIEGVARAIALVFNASQKKFFLPAWDDIR